MTTYAQRERAALCDTALAVGPNAPTLCEGWDVRDLMAHLAMRERRVEAVGVVVKPFEKYAEHVRKRYALRPFDDLVTMVRRGPYEFSPFRIPGVDAKANLSEYFIHHEDILRAQPGAADTPPRQLPAGEQDALYERLPTMSRLILRHSGFRVAAVCPGKAPLQLAGGKDSDGEVLIVGEPGEVLLYLSGRTSIVELQGQPDDVARFEAEDHSI